MKWNPNIKISKFSSRSLWEPLNMIVRVTVFKWNQLLTTRYDKSVESMRADLYVSTPCLKVNKNNFVFGFVFVLFLCSTNFADRLHRTSRSLFKKKLFQNTEIVAIKKKAIISMSSLLAFYFAFMFFFFFCISFLLSILKGTDKRIAKVIFLWIN